MAEPTIIEEATLTHDQVHRIVSALTSGSHACFLLDQLGYSPDPAQDENPSELRASIRGVQDVVNAHHQALHGGQLDDPKWFCQACDAGAIHQFPHSHSLLDGSTVPDCPDCGRQLVRLHRIRQWV
jgi:hypothetical protein